VSTRLSTSRCCVDKSQHSVVSLLVFFQQTPDGVNTSRHLESLRKILNGVDTLPTNGGAHRALHCGRTARRGEGMQGCCGGGGRGRAVGADLIQKRAWCRVSILACALASLHVRCPVPQRDCRQVRITPLQGSEDHPSAGK
jgi:hypothetical protein